MLLNSFIYLFLVPCAFLKSTNLSLQTTNTKNLSIFLTSSKCTILSIRLCTAMIYALAILVSRTLSRALATLPYKLSCGISILIIFQQLRLVNSVAQFPAAKNSATKGCHFCLYALVSYNTQLTHTRVCYVHTLVYNENVESAGISCKFFATLRQLSGMLVVIYGPCALNLPPSAVIQNSLLPA